MKRETFKDVDIAGRKWRVMKFDALTGSYVATVVMMKALPALLKMFKGDGGDVTAVAGGLMGGLNMTKQEFMDLQRDCLGVCRELSDVNGTIAPMPVLMADGRFANSDLATDPVTVLMLTAHAVVFNLSVFFAEGALDSMKTMIQQVSSPSDAKM